MGHFWLYDRREPIASSSTSLSSILYIPKSYCTTSPDCRISGKICVESVQHATARLFVSSVDDPSRTANVWLVQFDRPSYAVVAESACLLFDVRTTPQAELICSKEQTSWALCGQRYQRRGQSFVRLQANNARRIQSQANRDLEDDIRPTTELSVYVGTGFIIRMAIIANGELVSAKWCL
jgi:hypothetical protein